VWSMCVVPRVKRCWVWAQGTAANVRLGRGRFRWRQRRRDRSECRCWLQGPALHLEGTATPTPPAHTRTHENQPNPYLRQPGVEARVSDGAGVCVAQERVIPRCQLPLSREGVLHCLSGRCWGAHGCGLGSRWEGSGGSVDPGGGAAVSGGDAKSKRFAVWCGGEG